MKLINTQANPKRHKKIKTTRDIIIAAVMLLFAGGGIFMSIQLHFIVTVAIPTVGVFLLIGAVVSGIVAFSFSRKLKKTNDFANEDFSNNLAICDHCGRFFAVSELHWKNGSYNKKETIYDDKGTHISYKYVLTVTGECPHCGTPKGVVIEEDGGSESSGLKHVMFTDDKFKEYHNDNTTKYDDKQLVKEKLQSDKLRAEGTLNEYMRMGYVIDKTDSSKETQQKEKAEEKLYGVYLDECGDNTAAVIDVLKAYVYNQTKAALLAEVGGLIEDNFLYEEALMLIEDLESVGAKAHKEVTDRKYY